MIALDRTLQRAQTFHVIHVVVGVIAPSEQRAKGFTSHSASIDRELVLQVGRSAHAPLRPMQPILSFVFLS